MGNDYLEQLISELSERIHSLEELSEMHVKKIKQLESKVAELESDVDDLKGSIDDLGNP
jgi:phage shock protein A